MKYFICFPLALASLLSGEEDVCSTIEYCQLVYPSCRFETQCGFGLYLTIEGLYWVAKENGLIIAQEGVPAPGPQTGDVPPTSFNFHGKILRIDPHLDWGVRLGLGYNFCFDEWDAKATWTHYNTQKNAQFQTDGSTFALNLWAHTDVSSSSVSSLIKARFDLQYHTLDIEWGRAFGAGRYFCLRPHFGIRAAWVDQTLTNFNQVALKDRPGQSLSTDLKALSNFTGAGPHFGLDGRFDILCNISLFGLARYSLNYGSFDTSFWESASGDNPESPLPPVENLVIADARDHFGMSTSSLQLGLGIQWNKGLCANRFRLGLHIDWEQNLWLQLNQMNHFQHEFQDGVLFQESGNLSLQGISFGARFDF